MRWLDRRKATLNSSSASNARHQSKTLAEALRYLLIRLSPEEKAEIRAFSSGEKFAEASHFGFSILIRNVLLHDNKQWRALTADMRRIGGRAGDFTPGDADGQSAAIACLLWDALRERICCDKGKIKEAPK